MSQLNEVAAKLDAALGRLEKAADAQIQSSSDSIESSAYTQLQEEAVSLRDERDALQQQNALLREDAAGLSRRLTVALHRLDTLLASVGD